ncbi:MAG: decaprenyl-phosphate phosphoribosyltransferase, partial [Candidatus Omnitrophica bacterium]|nr:decaprenyl-phosphate phosphoribosyltransferase [Candidatus Omnitrophota bacterium]
MKYLIFSLRPKHWIKNFFIFLPLIFGGKLFVYPFNLKACLAFVFFSLASGAVYIINDIIDLPKDRRHPIKKLRPLASGRIKVKTALTSAVLISLLAVIASFFVNLYLGFIVIIYLISNLLYSFFLKEIVIIDVFSIGLFFLLRVIAGSFASNVILSHWIIIMTVLLALFLGFNKRRQEVRVFQRKASSYRSVLKKYQPYFIDQMIAVITSSIVVVYMLYTIDARTVKELGTNKLIYSIPFVYYGIFRYLYLINRQVKDGDPTRLLLFDKMLQLNILLWIFVCITVIYLPI